MLLRQRAIDAAAAFKAKQDAEKVAHQKVMETEGQERIDIHKKNIQDAVKATFAKQAAQVAKVEKQAADEAAKAAKVKDPRGKLPSPNDMKIITTEGNKQNPNMRAWFDHVYGEGAADIFAPLETKAEDKPAGGPWKPTEEDWATADWAANLGKQTKPLDKATADAFLKQAGNDLPTAKRLASLAGYDVSKF